VRILTEPLQIAVEVTGDASSFNVAVKQVQAGAKSAIKAAKDMANANLNEAKSSAGAITAANKHIDVTDKLRQARIKAYVTAKQLATQEVFLQNAWKKGSQTIDKQYLQSINGLQRAYQRFNREAQHTIVIHKGLITTLDDPGLFGTRFMMKANLAIRTLDNMAKNVINLGKNAQWTGRQMMVGITAPLIGGAAAAVKFYMSIAAVDVQLKKVLGGELNDKDLIAVFNRLEKQSNALSVQFGIQRAEVKKVQTEFAQIGFPPGEIENLTKITTQFAKLGDVDPTQAVELVRVLRQAGVEGSSLTSELAKFNAISDQTNLDLNSIAASVPKLFPLMQKYGVTASQTAAMIAAITQAGFPAETAANKLTTAFTKLPAALGSLFLGAKSSTRGLRDLKVQIQEINKALPDGKKISFFNKDGSMRDATSMIFDLSKAYGALQKTQPGQARTALLIRSLFGGNAAGEGVQLLETISKSLNGDKANDFAKAMNIATDASASYLKLWDKQISRVLADPSVKFQGQVEKMRNAAQELGRDLVPIATKVFAKINTAIDKFNSLSDETKKRIFQIAAFFAVLGPTVYIAGQALIAFGTIARGLIAPFKSFFNIKSKFKELGDGFADVSDQLFDLRQGFIDGRLSKEDYLKTVQNVVENNAILATSTDAVTAATARQTAAQGALTASVAGSSTTGGKKTTLDEMIAANPALASSAGVKSREQIVNDLTARIVAKNSGVRGARVIQNPERVKELQRQLEDAIKTQRRLSNSNIVGEAKKGLTPTFGPNIQDSADHALAEAKKLRLVRGRLAAFRKDFGFMPNVTSAKDLADFDTDYRRLDALQKQIQKYKELNDIVSGMDINLPENQKKLSDLAKTFVPMIDSNPFLTAGGRDMAEEIRAQIHSGVGRDLKLPARGGTTKGAGVGESIRDIVAARNGVKEQRGISPVFTHEQRRSMQRTLLDSSDLPAARISEARKAAKLEDVDWTDLVGERRAEILRDLPRLEREYKSLKRKRPNGEAESKVVAKRINDTRDAIANLKKELKGIDVEITKAGSALAGTSTSDSSASKRTARQTSFNQKMSTNFNTDELMGEFDDFLDKNFAPNLPQGMTDENLKRIKGRAIRMLGNTPDPMKALQTYGVPKEFRRALGAAIYGGASPLQYLKILKEDLGDKYDRDAQIAFHRTASIVSGGLPGGKGASARFNLRALSGQTRRQRDFLDSALDEVQLSNMIRPDNDLKKKASSIKGLTTRLSKAPVDKRDGLAAKIVAAQQEIVATRFTRDMSSLTAAAGGQARGANGQFLPKGSMLALKKGMSADLSKVMREMLVTQVDDAKTASAVVAKHMPNLSSSERDKIAQAARVAVRNMTKDTGQIKAVFGAEVVRAMQDYQRDMGNNMLAHQTETSSKKSARRGGGSRAIEQRQRAIANAMADVSDDDKELKTILTGTMGETQSQVDKRLDDMRDAMKFKKDLDAKIENLESFAEKATIDGDKIRKKQILDRVKRLRAERAEAVAVERAAREELGRLVSTPLGVDEGTIRARVSRNLPNGIVGRNENFMRGLIAEQQANLGDVASARGIETQGRVLGDVKSFRRRQYVGLLAGNNFSTMDHGELGARTQLHGADVASGRSRRSYSTSAVRSYQKARADVEATMAENPYFQFVQGDARERIINNRVGNRAGRRGIGEVFSSARSKGARTLLSEGAEKTVGKVGSGVSRIATSLKSVEGIGGKALSAAMWATPLAPLKVANKGVRGLFTGFSSLKNIGQKAEPMLTGMFGEMGTGMTTVLSTTLSFLPLIALVAGAIFLIWKNWDKVSKGVGSGIEKLKTAFKGVVSAAITPFKNLWAMLTKSGDTSKSLGNIWQNVGKVLGAVSTVLAKVLTVLKPIISLFSEFLARAIFQVVQIVRVLMALLSGDFGDALDGLKAMWGNTWQFMLKIVGYVGQGIIEVFFRVAKMVVDTFTSVFRFLGKGLSLIGLKNNPLTKMVNGIDHSIDGLRKKSKSLFNGFFKNNDFTSEANKAGPAVSKAGQSLADRFGKSFADQLTKDTATINDAAAEQAAAWRDAFLKNMEAVTSDWKDAALKSFDVWADAQKKIIEDKGKAIDAEVDLEKKKQEDLDYLQKKEEIRNKRRQAMDQYQSSRQLAIYEGRYDDAKQLDYENLVNQQQFDKDEKDLEDDRNKQLVDRKRDDQKKQLDIEKETLEKTLATKRDQFEAQLDMFTRYTPLNEAAARTMQQKILSAMGELTGGYSKIGAEQAAKWNEGWSTAIANTRTDMLYDAAKAGDETIRTFAAAAGVEDQLTMSPEENIARVQEAINAGSQNVHAKPGGRSMFHTGGALGNASMAPADIPITAQIGEYMIQRKAVKKYGLGMLEALNSGQLDMYHTGGQIQNSVAAGMAKNVLSAVKSKIKSGGNVLGMTAAGMTSSLRNKFAGGRTSSTVMDTSTGPVSVEKQSLKNLAMSMMAQYGWGLDQWPYLDRLVTNESGWRADAANPSSNARGMFQFMPAAWKSYIEALGGPAYWAADPLWQIRGGLGYIKGRYGNPMAALAHWNARVPIDGKDVGNWYHTGGLIQKGNIDLKKRPVHKNKDGSISTVRSASIEVDGKEVLIPTIAPDGTPMNIRQAIDWYRKSGQNLGTFDSIKHANAYAQELHNKQARYYGIQQGSLPEGMKKLLQAQIAAGPWFHTGGLVQLAKGGSVLRDGIAKIHKGETVVTADLSDKLVKGINNLEAGGSGPHVHLHFEGGFFGTDRDYEKLGKKIKEVSYAGTRARGEAPKTFRSQ
jgi:TP901 family phage tail tape measure protein